MNDERHGPSCPVLAQVRRYRSIMSATERRLVERLLRDDAAGRTTLGGNDALALTTLHRRYCLERYDYRHMLYQLRDAKDRLNVADHDYVGDLIAKVEAGALSNPPAEVFAELRRLLTLYLDPVGAP